MLSTVPPQKKVTSASSDRGQVDIAEDGKSIFLTATGGKSRDYAIEYEITDREENSSASVEVSDNDGFDLGDILLGIWIGIFAMTLAGGVLVF